MTGTTWVEESGLLAGPVGITNTHSVGVVRDAMIAWALQIGLMHEDEWSLPVVAETWDGWLNDINGFHVKQADVFAALDGGEGRPSGRGQHRAAARGWSATASRAAPGRLRACCRRTMAATR